VKGCYVGDLFSGHGGVAKAARQAGFSARDWELLHGTEGDLCRPAVQRVLIADAKQGKLIASMLAPPCSTFSPARDRTSVIRTREHPWGLVGISIKDQIKVDIGNRCIQAAIKLITQFDHNGIPWILENPHSSKIWFIAELIQLSNNSNTHTVITDFCQFGTPWRKRTRFLCGNIDKQDTERINKQCTGCGVCSKSGSKHFQLTGSNKQGIPWTRTAMPYPAKLCHGLAHALTAHKHY
jgi:hypothetical protein